MDAEFNGIVAANEAVKHLENPWKALLRREYLPFLFLAWYTPFLLLASALQACQSCICLFATARDVKLYSTNGAVSCAGCSPSYSSGLASMQ